MLSGDSFEDFKLPPMMIVLLSQAPFLRRPRLCFIMAELMEAGLRIHAASFTRLCQSIIE